MSLSKFFEPKSIAVIGASHEPEKIGYVILENLKVSFEGKIYPINPSFPEIQGLKAYPSVLDIEEAVELAIIVVPAKIVKDVVDECVKKKIKNIIVISSGFGETGDNKIEDEIKEIIKGKARLIGPNCIGIYKSGLDMMFLPRKRLKRPSDGVISFISQSGTLGIASLDLVAHKGLGISKFVSYGNALDVNETDLIEYLSKDLETRCIAAYIESIKDGKRFMEIAKKTSKIKPIVILKAGRTEKGMEASKSHTGALAGSSQIYSAVFKQAGIIEARTTGELFIFAKALANQPALRSNRIGIITNGGGFGILAADSIVENGLMVAEFDKETEKILKKGLPNYCSVGNPVDIAGDADVDRFEKGLKAIFEDKNVDGVLCSILFQTPKIEDLIIPVLEGCKAYGKPLVVCSPGGEYSLERIRKLERLGIPVYSAPERAVKALRALREYGEIIGKK